MLFLILLTIQSKPDWRTRNVITFLLHKPPTTLPKGDGWSWWLDELCEDVCLTLAKQKNMKLPPTLPFIRWFQLYSSSCCWSEITAAGYEFWIWLFFQIHTEKHKHAELNWVILLLCRAAEMWRWIRWGCEIRFDGDHLWGQNEGGLSCLLDQNGIEPSSTWFGLVAPSWKTISQLAGFFHSFAMCGHDCLIYPRRLPFCCPAERSTQQISRWFSWSTTLAKHTPT